MLVGHTGACGIISLMHHISAEELFQLLERESITLIDVREPAEHESAAIPGSSLIPLGIISASKLPVTTGKIVTYCMAGFRSQDAAKILLSKDPTLDIYSLDGGIIAWKNAGFPIVPGTI